jgi:hypothetical protein
MKILLVLTGVLEAATGVALMVAPVLVGRWLLGTELGGVSIVVARVAGIALFALLAGTGIARHVDIQRTRHRVFCVARSRRPMGRAAVVAGRRVARGPCHPAGTRLARAPKDLRKVSRPIIDQLAVTVSQASQANWN